MEFTNEFDVGAPVDEVFNALLDIERSAACVPGAQVLEKVDDGKYKVAIKVKLGPVTMQYRGDVEVVEKDEAAHTATMHVRAKEARGQGNADATSRIVLTESGSGGTHATITTDVKLSGKAAAMGGRMVGDVSAKMVDTFATNLAAMLEGPGDEPVEAADETPSPADDAPEAGTPTTVETAAVEADAGDAPSADGPSLPKPPPLREAPPPAADAELDALDLAGSVIAGRLSDPKTLAAVLGGAFAVGFLLGRRSS